MSTPTPALKQQPKARVQHVTDPSDSSRVRLDPDWREPSNDGELTQADLDAIDAEFRQPDATDRAMDCLKRGFLESLSFSEAQRLEADLHNNRLKCSGELDRRREADAAQVEADRFRWQR